MAYLQPVSRPKCYCGKFATCRLINFVNAPLGYFCAPHGKRALEQQKKGEEGKTP